MRINDALSGLLLIGLGVGLAVYAGTFPTAPGQGVGPGFFPLLIGGGIVLGGVVLTAASWARRRESPWIAWDEGLRQPRRARNAALVVGALIFYALAVDTVGFFLTSGVILAGLFWAFEVRGRWIVPVAVAVTLGLHLAFYTLLRVPLPWGWLEGMAW